MSEEDNISFIAAEPDVPSHCIAMRHETNLTTRDKDKILALVIEAVDAYVDGGSADGWPLEISISTLHAPWMWVQIHKQVHGFGVPT